VTRPEKATPQGLSPQARIENALARLAPLRTKSGLPPLSAREMDAHVHALLVSGGDSKRRRPLPTEDRIAEELRDIQKLAINLSDALTALSTPAASFFGNRAEAKRTIRTLGIVAGVSVKFSLASQSGGTEPDRLKPAEVLALQAACVFLVATGVRPTLINAAVGPVHGPFFDFLVDVFKARDMKASPENAAKTVVPKRLPRAAPAFPVMEENS